MRIVKVWVSCKMSYCWYVLLRFFPVPHDIMWFDSGHYHKFSPAISENKNFTHQVLQPNFYNI